LGKGLLRREHHPRQHTKHLDADLRVADRAKPERANGECLCPAERAGHGMWQESRFLGYGKSRKGTGAHIPRGRA